MDRALEWGYNGDGGLCNGLYGASMSVTYGTDSDNPLIEFASGSQSVCVRQYNNTMTCSGVNAKGQLGQPNMDGPLDPALVPAIDFGTTDAGIGVYAVGMAAGKLHTCALLNTGNVKCWGYNNQGQLGLGYASQAPTDYVGGDPDDRACFARRRRGIATSSMILVSPCVAWESRNARMVRGALQERKVVFI